MDNQTPLNAPLEPGRQLPSDKKSHIPMATTVIILIVALLAAAYLYTLSLRGKIPAELSNAANSGVSSSSDTASIEADLDKTNVNNSDQGLNNIDSSFRQ